MNSEHLFGTYFLGGPISHLDYLAMLGNWFTPQLQSLGIENNIWLEQDGVPVHFAITIREYFDVIFPGPWIGRGLPPCQLHLTGRLEVLT